MRAWLAGLLLGGLASLPAQGFQVEGSGPTREEILEAVGIEPCPLDILTWQWRGGTVEETRHVIAMPGDLPKVPAGSWVPVRREVRSATGTSFMELRWQRRLEGWEADSGRLSVPKPGWKVRYCLVHPVEEAPRVVEHLPSIRGPMRSRREESGWVIRKWEGSPDGGGTAGYVRWSAPMRSGELEERYLVDHESHCRPGEESKRLARHLGSWQAVYGANERDFADQCYWHVAVHIRPDPSIRDGEESLRLSRGDATAALVCLLRAGGIPARVILARSWARFPDSLDAIEAERVRWSSRGVMAYPDGRQRCYFPDVAGLEPHEAAVSCRGSTARAFSQGCLRLWRLPHAGQEPQLRRIMRLDLSTGRATVERMEEGQRCARVISRSPCRGLILGPDEGRSVDKARMTTWARGRLACSGRIPPLTPLPIPAKEATGEHRIAEDLLLEDVLIIEGCDTRWPFLERAFSAPGLSTCYEMASEGSTLRITRRARWRAGVLNGPAWAETLGILRLMRSFEEGILKNGS